MKALDTAPRLEAPDDFYAALIAAHEGLSARQSEALNARLVLLLANQVGVQAVLVEALALALAAVQSVPSRSLGGASERDPDHDR